MSPNSSAIAKATLKYKRCTMVLAFLCCGLLLVIAGLFWSNHKRTQKLKELSHKMLDLKVQLENARRTMGDKPFAEDAVTYSTSGEAIPGIHMPSSEDFGKFPGMFAHEKFAQ
jgi:hypothetical protein